MSGGNLALRNKSSSGGTPGFPESCFVNSAQVCEDACRLQAPVQSKSQYNVLSTARLHLGASTGSQSCCFCDLKQKRHGSGMLVVLGQQPASVLTSTRASGKMRMPSACALARFHATSSSMGVSSSASSNDSCLLRCSSLRCSCMQGKRASRARRTARSSGARLHMTRFRLGWFLIGLVSILAQL